MKEEERIHPEAARSWVHPRFGIVPPRGSACRRFHRAELGEQRQVVAQPPQFGDLSVLDADEGYVGELNRLSGRRCAPKGAGRVPRSSTVS